MDLPALRDTVQTAVMPNKLYAALPMMHEGPSSPVGCPSVKRHSTIANKISGELVPIARSVMFATAQFHTGSLLITFFPEVSLRSTILVVLVMTYMH